MPLQAELRVFERETSVYLTATVMIAVAAEEGHTSLDELDFLPDLNKECK